MERSIGIMNDTKIELKFKAIYKLYLEQKKELDGLRELVTNLSKGLLNLQEDLDKLQGKH